MKDRRKGFTSRALIVRTLFILTVCGIAAFAVLAARLYDIQIVNNSQYEAMALSGQLRQSTINASRGTIYDANGKILAMSASVSNVFISPLEIERDGQDAEFIAEGLSAILGVGRDAILEKAMKTGSQYEMVKMRVESGEAAQVNNFISENKLKGIHLEPSTKRYYPQNCLASQVLGFVGTDDTGLYGLEQRYNGYLTGVSGRSVRLTNARGANLGFSDFEDSYDALDGYDIKLTIDSSVQYYVEKHLSQAIVDYDILNGAVCIAMNAKTGAILAMASYPTYDPNNYLSLGERELGKLTHIEDEDEYRDAVAMAQFLQWRNRSLSDTYEPGSVFKIMTLAMALEENVATPDSWFECAGSMEVVGRVDKEQKPLPVRCWRRWGHGPQTLRDAIRNSCNLVCVELGLRLGPETFYKYVEAFGLREKTGLDSESEVRGKWWEDSVFFDRRNQSQLASSSFGQTFSVTPIQMITAVASVVNGGYLMQPYIVAQVTDSAGNVVEANEPTVLRQVISAGTSATVRSILQDVVETGTGKNASIRGYSVGGKTGTSENTTQIATSEEGARKDYIVSFVGFAPANDPEIVILLLLDTPSHETGINISGGSMAAPVVGNMLADILPLSLGIRPQYTEEDLRDINVNMIRLTGRSVEEAKELLASQGFEFTVAGDGDIVTGQLPATNALISSGSKVRIFAGEDAPHEPVTVPGLSGLSYGSAKQTLESRGLFIRTAGVPKSDGSALVSVQSVPAGSEVAYGSIVEITLIDKDIIEMPT